MLPGNSVTSRLPRRRLAYPPPSFLLAILVASAQPAETSVQARKPRPSETPMVGVVAFTPNTGQMSDDVLFMSHCAGGETLLTTRGLRVTVADQQQPLRGRAHGLDRTASPPPMRTLTIRPVGAHLTVTSASERLEGNVSYFLGSNPGRWRTRLPRFHRVVFSNAYPGIDLAVYGRESGPSTTLSSDQGRTRALLTSPSRERQA